MSLLIYHISVLDTGLSVLAQPSVPPPEMTWIQYILTTVIYIYKSTYQTTSRLECLAGRLLQGEKDRLEKIPHSNKPPALYPPIRVPFDVCASWIGTHVAIDSLLM